MFRACVVLCLLSGMLISTPSVANAQFGMGGGMGMGGMGMGGMGMGGMGGLGGGLGAGGIIIDAEGVVRTVAPERLSPTRLKKMQEEFAQGQLPADMVISSDQRVLSLRALERDVKRALDAEELVPGAALLMGGIQRLDYVIFDPENNDVLIAGPAEGFAPNPHGRLVGLTTGRPPLQLDDLVTALRSRNQGERSIGVSIDPTEENLARLQQFIRTNAGPTTSAGGARLYRTMGEILGQQEVNLWGVPEDSHYALILVEADYRMKRIALGKEPAGVRGIRSHLSLLAPQGNSLQRWWFMPLYEPLETSDDGRTFRITGQRAQLMAQEEISDSLGQRTDAALTRHSTEKFAELFTEHFEQLAEKSPEFAELQNLYDLALLAALIDREGRRLGIDWDLDTFLNDDRLPIGKYSVPKYVPSESVHRKAGRGALVGLIGGVTVEVDNVAGQTRVSRELNEVRIQSPGKGSNWWSNGGGD
jgi:hypothetical protein